MEIQYVDLLLLLPAMEDRANETEINIRFKIFSGKKSL